MGAGMLFIIVGAASVVRSRREESVDEKSDN
jgi:hypothetical protein